MKYMARTNGSGVDAVRDDEQEVREWLESLDSVVHGGGVQTASRILSQLRTHAQVTGIRVPFTANTPYVNTIHVSQQPEFPGDQEIERRIKSFLRWNALAMVVRANREEHGIGGHISTYASAATLFEVGFNHFFRARTQEFEGDIVYFQGHASPGIYARAFLEGRLSVQQLENFRRELKPGGGLSSYPHPWLMPDFWEFPTVSMGLGPIIGHLSGALQPLSRSARPEARHGRQSLGVSGRRRNRRARNSRRHHAGFTRKSRQPDLRRQLQPAAARWSGARKRQDRAGTRSRLPRRRLERHQSPLGQRLGSAASIAIRMGCSSSAWAKCLMANSKSSSSNPARTSASNILAPIRGLLDLAENIPDEQFRKLRLGGHDPRKVYAAYKAATEHKGAPTVILARTIKGYGLGEAGEGRNITHQQKKLNEDELREFRTRFNIPDQRRSDRRNSVLPPAGR